MLLRLGFLAFYEFWSQQVADYLQPFGDNGQGSLAELNKRIQESAEKPQPTSSSDTSDAGSTGQAGSITMNRLAKGVPVGASPTHY